MQSLTSMPSTARSVGWGSLAVAVLGITGWMWFSSIEALRWVAFLLVWAGLSFALIFFLSSPLQWLNYLLFQAFFLALTLLRLCVKLVVVVLSIVLSAIYFISPIDLIPDLLLGLGWIDDVLIAWALISWAWKAQIEIPMPSVSAEEVSEQPLWKRLLAILLAGTLTWLLHGWSR
jgi:uncharacterized membrane protein YkvA (DUF1232 family)